MMWLMSFSVRTGHDKGGKAILSGNLLNCSDVAHLGVVRTHC